MKITKSWGVILLSIWLILTGVLPLVKFSFAGLDILMSILAIAAGILLLLRK